MDRIIEGVMMAAVDAAKIVLAGENVAAPATYRETLLKLGEIGLIAAQDASELAGFAELRNILAHRYLESRWPEVERFLRTGTEVVGAMLTEVSKGL